MVNKQVLQRIIRKIIKFAAVIDPSPRRAYGPHASRTSPRSGVRDRQRQATDRAGQKMGMRLLSGQLERILLPGANPELLDGFISSPALSPVHEVRDC